MIFQREIKDDSSNDFELNQQPFGWLFFRAIFCCSFEIRNYQNCFEAVLHSIHLEMACYCSK